MDICRREFGLCVLAGVAGRAFAQRPRPKLFVLVILEQLRSDAVESLAPQFGPGGLRRLQEKGAWFPDCRHLASGFSASGIATLATGAWPAEHGIVADSWYGRASRNIVRASGDDLLATTLAAQIAAESRTRVFAVSLDRAHAALVAGTPGARLFWMDERCQFASGADAPDWLADYNRLAPVESAHNAEWMALGARVGAPPLRTLRFDPNKPEEYLALYKSSPFAEEAQFAFLAELIARERLGQGDTFDFVCLVAGSSALLGYETGGRSPLMEQMTLQLDRHLEALFSKLDEKPGANAFSLALTAAHGAPPAPAEASRVRMAVRGGDIAHEVQRSLESNGNGSVERFVYPFLYLDAGGSRDPEAVRLAAARAAMRQPAVAGYYTAGGACSTHDEWERRFRNSFHPTRSGDVMLSYQPEFVEDYGADRGISYGSIYNYDACVPLFLFGPQFRAGVFESPVESVDVAPTLARALGVAAPSSSTGRVLGQALGLGEE
jgi:hypothetical protein